MNHKTRYLVGASVGFVLSASAAAIMFWPRETPSPAATPHFHDVESTLGNPPARFEHATVLTATVPSTLSSTLPLAIPSVDTPLDRASFEPFAPAVPTSTFPETAPVSFMPERLSLAENSPWQNGWDEPVTETGAGLLSKLPDWSAAAEWLTPASHVANTVVELAAPVESFSEPSVPKPNTPSYGEPTYTVRARDTLWTISQKVYGTGALFAALAEHNRAAIANPRALEVGQTLATPPGAWLAQRYPNHCPEPTNQKTDGPLPTVPSKRRPEYAVRPGDTLERIAVIRLGRADRWGEILALNHDVVGASGGYLTPGMVLGLPDDARSAATVLRPTDRPR